MIESFTKGDANVFDGVMLIDVEVTLSCNFQVESTVPGKQFEHVIQKANASRDFILPAAFNVEGDANLGFRGLAMESSSSGA